MASTLKSKFKTLLTTLQVNVINIMRLFHLCEEFVLPLFVQREKRDGEEEKVEESVGVPELQGSAQVCYIYSQ